MVLANPASQASPTPAAVYVCLPCPCRHKRQSGATLPASLGRTCDRSPGHNPYQRWLSPKALMTGAAPRSLIRSLPSRRQLKKEIAPYSRSLSLRQGLLDAGQCLPAFYWATAPITDWLVRDSPRWRTNQPKASNYRAKSNRYFVISNCFIYIFVMKISVISIVLLGQFAILILT